MADVDHGDINTPDEALDVIIFEAGWSDMHGGDHHDDDCPICRSIAMIRAGLNHAYAPSHERPKRRRRRSPISHELTPTPTEGSKA
jgi:hypothetical protein